MATITFYLLLVSIFQGKCIATKQFRTILALVSYSDSLRCYGGKGGGKFQECHQDDGYKTCFTKYENGNIITHEECVCMRNIPLAQAPELRGAARPRGRCCMWSARRTRARACWRSSATALTTSATPPSLRGWTGRENILQKNIHHRTKK